MKIFNSVKYLVVATLLVAAVACNNKGKNENEKLINEAIQNMEDNPKQAASLLQRVNVGLLSESDYNYYILQQVQAWDWAGESISLTDTVVCKARNYFIKKNDAEKAAFACFIEGKIYLLKDMHEQAVSSFQQADDWAAKANYKTSCIAYTAIPYNIAWLYFKDKKYDEALTLVNKALQHINPENKYTRQLYALELKGSIFRNIDKLDSAELYYNKALDVATQHNDTKSSNRINYNLATLLYIHKDYTGAEKQYRQVLAQTPATDSVYKGGLYLGLAKTYLVTEKIDSAYTNIYIAKSLLANINEFYLKEALYNDLITIEQQKGNVAKAQEYQQVYDKLKAGQNVKQSTEITTLELKLKQEQEERIAMAITTANQTHKLAQKQGRTITMLVLAMVLITLATGVIIYKQLKTEKKVARLTKELKTFGLASVVNNAWLKRGVQQLIDWVEEVFSDNEDYIKRNTISSKIIDLLPHSAYPEWVSISELSIYFEELFEDYANTFDELNDDEYRLLCMRSIDIITDPKEMARFLQLTDDDFERTQASMEKKFATYYDGEVEELIAEAKRYKANFLAGNPPQQHWLKA